MICNSWILLDIMRQSMIILAAGAKFTGTLTTAQAPSAVFADLRSSSRPQKWCITSSMQKKRSYLVQWKKKMISKYYHMYNRVTVKIIIAYQNKSNIWDVLDPSVSNHSATCLPRANQREYPRSSSRNQFIAKLSTKYENVKTKINVIYINIIESYQNNWQDLVNPFKKILVLV